MTLGNAKSIDLYAEKGTKVVNVQVKAIRNRKSVGWPMMRDKVIPNIIYVFVCLNDSGVSPDYFVCTSEETLSKVKQYTTRGIVDLMTLRDPTYQGRWDKIELALDSKTVTV